jgi:hypothetical protein
MQSPKRIGKENAKKKERAGYTDQSKEEIECLFDGRYVGSPD